MLTIDVTGLCKGFRDDDVLAGVSFSASAGDILSVIGPSGCGKTTLFRCILGELDPDEGSIVIGGRDVTHVPVEKRGVGIVYQNYALFPHMTVAQNVAYGLRARGVGGRETDERVAEMLGLVRMPEKGDKMPDEISGGERQRVALARALAVRPQVLLLDEAFAALDATTRSDVVHEVRTIIRRMGVTTLLVTHDQEEAFLFSRSVLVLNEGQVVTQGTPEEVMQHPHPFIQSFVKMILLTRSKVEADRSGSLYVSTEGGQRIPIKIPGVTAGDEVNVMIKKSPQGHEVAVWTDETG